LSHMLEENSHIHRVQKSQQRKHEEEDQSKNDVFRNNIIKWAEMYERTELPDFLRNFIARLYIKHNLESIRAIEAMQQGAVLHSVIHNRDKVQVSDVTHMIPLVLKHRVDNDTLIKMINDVDSRGGKEGILNFRGRKNKSKEEDTEYFQHNARALKDMHRGELVNTEKSLTPTEY